jgi:glycosyltransferase involved in cell wall biosynthesis
MNKKHIVVNSWNYPQGGKRGNPYLYDMIYSLSKRGHKVTVLDIQFWGLNHIKRVLKPTSNYKQIEGVNIFVIPILNLFPNFSSLFPRLYNAWVKRLMYKRILQYEKKFGKPDFIQHHFIINTPPFYTEYWSEALSIPYILFEHSFNVNLSDIQRRKWNNYDVDNVMKFVKNAKFRIARTHYAKTYYEEIYNCEFNAIPNFIPESYFMPQKDGRNNKRFIFIIVGSLIERKAQERVILAFNSKFKNNEFELWIVGGGALFKHYEEKIKKLGLDRQVLLLGEKSKTEVFSLINESDVLVVSSVNETFGNTVIEAFFLGKPVISTKCGGPEELIDDSNGILCGHSSEEIAEAMVSVYNKYFDYDNIKIKNQALAKYAEEAIMKKMEEVYTSVF